MMNTTTSVTSDSYLNATGRIPYGMTNDYMFRAVLQNNERVLKGLISALLHLEESDLESVVITNPIMLGDDIDEKTFILDINVMLNNNTQINLEMQMANEHNWEDRSLSYLCRSFDQLYHGQSYSDAKPVIHIGFLNFPPYPGSTEFYATYKLLNEKNFRVYSDKFVLSVIDLTHIEQATDTDREAQIDFWARLFTATSWEELKMIAEQNDGLSEATQALYELNSDLVTQQKCRARIEYYQRQRTYERDMRILKEKRKELETANAELETANAELETANAELETANAELETANAELETANAELETANAELKTTNVELETVNVELQVANVSLEKEVAALRAELEYLKNHKE